MLNIIGGECMSKSNGLSFSAAQLKVIAAAAMLIDHINKVFAPFSSYVGFGYYFSTTMEGIGRIAFPIFVYFVAVGCMKTHDMRRYLLRLLAVGLLSEPFYDFAFSSFNYMRYTTDPATIDNPLIQEWTAHVTLWQGGIQNVCFGLFLGAFAVFCYQRYRAHSSRHPGRRILLLVLLIAVWMLLWALAALGQCDYWQTVVPLAVLLYAVPNEPLRLAVLAVWCAAEYLFLPMGGRMPIEASPSRAIFYTVMALIACALLWRYHGEKGRRPLRKYFFYVFYPGHLLVLGLIREICILIKF